MRLLRDNEAEVRIAAAGKVTKFCRILNPDLAIQHILPCVKVHFFCFGLQIQYSKNYIYRLNYSATTFAGIVDGFFAACSFCFGFSNNGNGSSVRKGTGVK